MIKKILLILLASFVVMQFFRIDMTNPEVDASKDFIAVTQASDEVVDILKTACYDCHTHETVYPWYANVAPISWWLKGHVDEGKEHLNFSEWADYSVKKADHKLEECVESINEGWMPIGNYTLTHSDAILEDDQRTVLIDFFESLRTYEEE
ncbi:MAG: heme-binding domain-containing protein [Crocinitomicaceae bacterium]|nr:heme-binding domain-containing protein [Crocinitomicaceae bacterium]